MITWFCIIYVYAEIREGEAVVIGVDHIAEYAEPTELTKLAANAANQAQVLRRVAQIRAMFRPSAEL